MTATSGDRLARNSALMASGSLVSRILGVVRQSMIFAIFSMTTAGDTWQVANAIPNAVFFLVAGGVLNAVLVPQITKADAEGGEAGHRYVDTLVTLCVLGLGLVTAVCIPLAPWLVRLFASTQTWDGGAFRLSTQFALLCLPAVFFYGLYTVLGQVLNARGRFGAYMWAPVVCNVVWIVGLAVYLVRFHGRGRAVADWNLEMVWLLGGTMTLGVAAQALVLLVPLHRTGFRYRPRFAFRGIGLRSAGTVATWTFLALLVGQIGQIVVSKVLTSVAHGDAGRIGYDNAYLLFMTPQGLVTVSLVTALFTGMSKAVQTDRTGLLARDVRRGMRLILLTTVPISAAAIALGPAGTRLIYPGNSVQATDAVAYVLWAMILGLPAFGVYYLVQRAFYAFEDARTPFRLQLVNTGLVMVTALVCFLAPSAYRAVGVALGMTVANIATMVVAVRLLDRRLGGLYLRDVTSTFRRVLAASAPAALAAYAVFLGCQAVLPLRLAAAVAVVLGGAVFLGLFALAVRALRLTELLDLVAPLGRRLRGRRQGRHAHV